MGPRHFDADEEDGRDEDAEDDDVEELDDLKSFKKRFDLHNLYTVIPRHLR